LEIRGKIFFTAAILLISYRYSSCSSCC